MELLQNLQPRLVPMHRSLGFLSNTLQLVHSAYKRMFPRRYSTPSSQLGFQTQEWLLLFSFSPVFFFLPPSSAHSSLYSASFRSPWEPQGSSSASKSARFQSVKYSVSEPASSEACLGSQQQLQGEPRRSRRGKALRKPSLEKKLSKISRGFSLPAREPDFQNSISDWITFGSVSTGYRNSCVWKQNFCFRSWSRNRAFGSLCTPRLLLFAAASACYLPETALLGAE